MNRVYHSIVCQTNRMVLGISLFIFWLILGGSFDSRQIITGIMATIITLIIYDWLLLHTKIAPLPRFPKLNWVLFLITMVRFIFQSAWHHFGRILSGNEDISFIQVTLDVKHPYAQTLIANAVTLAPGTVSVDLEKDILKVLCFSPQNEKERDAIYKMIDSLQLLFKEVTSC